VTLTADAVARLLESRFDWYSARVKLREAAQAAGSGHEGPFDAEGVHALADAIAKSGEEALSHRVRAAAPAKATPPTPAPAEPESDLSAPASMEPAEEARRPKDAGRPHGKK
jgi:hypothetical protein